MQSWYEEKEGNHLDYYQPSLQSYAKKLKVVPSDICNPTK